MLLKLFTTTILIFLLIVLQLSFIKSLPSPLATLNLILAVVVFVTLLNYKKALWAAFIFGILLDIYSFRGFGLTIISLLLVVLLTNVLFKNLFTNRSLFSLLVLGAIATVFFEFLIFIFNHLYFYLKLLASPPQFSWLFFYHLFWQIGLNSLFLGLVYYFFRHLGQSDPSAPR